MAIPAFLAGFAALLVTAGSPDHGTPSILTGATAIPVGPGRWVDPVADFPARARRDGQDGIVVMRVFVNGDGRATSCITLESPGVLALELATCRILRSRARFVPFAGSGLATFEYRVVWDLDDLPPLMPPNLSPTADLVSVSGQ